MESELVPKYECQKNVYKIEPYIFYDSEFISRQSYHQKIKTMSFLI